MDYLKALICILAVIAVAFVIGKMDNHKHPEAHHVYIWIGSIVLLLVLGGCL